MIVFGAKGFAKQLLPTLVKLDGNIVFYDQDTSITQLYNYPVIHELNKVQEHFRADNRFILGVGAPNLRKKLTAILEDVGGRLTTIINEQAIISTIETYIESGVQILQAGIVESFVSIQKGVLINVGAKICHDSEIGEYSEIGPNVTIAGGCTIGKNCSFGTSATIIPNLNIGNNVIVGAGAVVINDVQDNAVVVGVPAKVIKKLPSI